MKTFNFIIQEVFYKHYEVTLDQNQYEKMMMKIQDGDLTSEEYIMEYLMNTSNEIKESKAKDFVINLVQKEELTNLIKKSKELPYGIFN
jgi:Glu-tRNA(Gln) amidotransferase subunit E-like FAD-binding protein